MATTPNSSAAYMAFNEDGPGFGRSAQGPDSKGLNGMWQLAAWSRKPIKRKACEGNGSGLLSLVWQ